MNLLHFYTVSARKPGWDENIEQDDQQLVTEQILAICRTALGNSRCWVLSFLQGNTQSSLNQ